MRLRRGLTLLRAWKVSYFIRAILDKFEDVGEDPNCTVESVLDEIFDMVNPTISSCITAEDLHRCKVNAPFSTLLGFTLPGCACHSAHRLAILSWACLQMYGLFGNMTDGNNSFTPKKVNSLQALHAALPLPLL